MANNALQPTPQPRVARLRFPRSLRSLGAAERGRWTARSEGQTVGLPWAVVRIANAVTNLALLAGIPRPPYNRDNALIVETTGRRSGKRRRIPVGYLDDGG
jgi:hypothetical protein